MCPVCFSGADPVTRETLNAGIGVLLGVTVIVLGMFARFFVQLARRSRAAAHLVDHTSSGRPSSGRPAAFAEASVPKEGRPLREGADDIDRRGRPSLSAEASAKAEGRPNRRVA
jgi:hypothetical protein